MYSHIRIGIEATQGGMIPSVRSSKSLERASSIQNQSRHARQRAFLFFIRDKENVFVVKDKNTGFTKEVFLVEVGLVLFCVSIECVMGLMRDGVPRLHGVPRRLFFSFH